VVSACVKVAEEMAAVSEGGVGNGVGNVNMESVAGAKESKQPTRRKVIIDCDPGIDDIMAIFMVFQVPEIEVIGLTSTFGNVHTPLATKNCLHLLEVAGFPEVPVAEGVMGPLKGGVPEIADFVHGEDGLGNTNQANPKGQKLDISAAEFLVQKVAEFPGEVTVVTLAPLTNIALAIQKDPNFAKNTKQLVILGGAYYRSDDVKPAAEANMYSDPEAADITFTSGMNILVTGIDLTTQVLFTEQDLVDIRDSNGRHGSYVYDCCKFYLEWHRTSEKIDGMILHDPTSLVAMLDPTLFTSRKEAVRVGTEGVHTGHTLLEAGSKNWVGDNIWLGVPPVSVNDTVNAEAVKSLVKTLLSKP